MWPLEILQVAGHSEIISGGGVQMVLLARGVQALGHEVTCVFDSAPSPLEHTLEQVTRPGCGSCVPLAERLTFTGPRQDIPEVLAALDVAVSASATPWEGLSGVMRESLAMVRPVACTDVGGNRELVRDGETGRLAAAGHRLAVEKFSNPAHARTMESLCRRLAEPPAGS